MGILNWSRKHCIWAASHDAAQTFWNAYDLGFWSKAIWKYVSAALGGLCLASCTSAPVPDERLIEAKELAASRGWTDLRISSGRFDLLSFHPRNIQTARRLTIYIEGDGLAWLNRSRPSNDPTPINPIGLRLALSHPSGNAAYLGRPCQYRAIEDDICPSRYWTVARFAPEVVAASNIAINALKDRFGADELILVGFSGGGAIAALVAAQRTDVVRLVTVAGNIDHRAWTDYHNLTPLTGSLNAASYSEQIKSMQQQHFIGVQDLVIPPELALQWPREFTGDQGRNLHIDYSADHACCWDRNWPELFDPE